jgi:chromatin segregation and condensation protein Rec8/ScpA/Scc1 (kleisin family)
LTAGPADDERLLRVSLDVFNGPLDLLLSLVREQQLDIATVSLSTVADQYFAFISAMQDLDVELAAEYLVIAATLVFLKSKSLLPPIPLEFEDHEESAAVVESRLRERLIAYSKYRDAAADLRTRALEAAAYYLRAEGGDPTAELVQHYRVDAAKLAAALAAVRAGGGVRFFALVERLDRAGIIVTFLAVLELVRRGRLAFAQVAAFDDIELLPAVA